MLQNDCERKEYVLFIKKSVPLYDARNKKNAMGFLKKKAHCI